MQFEWLPHSTSGGLTDGSVPGACVRNHACDKGHEEGSPTKTQRHDPASGVPPEFS